MRRTWVFWTAVAAGAAIAALVPAPSSPGWAGSKDEELRALQDRLGDRGLVGDWIYDDTDGAFTVARRTGKPIFLVFR